jgi:leader peptidase (prepilin peptidase) / N-methyltransferase
LAVVHLLLIVLAAAYGAVAGAFVPRPLYRLAVEPAEPWRAACPRGHPLTGTAGGWLGRADCPGCEDGARSFGASAPLLAALTAVVCAGIAAAVGPRPELAVWLLLVPAGVLLAGVDRTVHRLPDVVTLPMAAVTAALLGLAALLPGSAGSWTRALLGGVALLGAYFVLFLINPAGFGFGDVKLALTLGIALGWYGWGVLVAGALVGLLLGSGYALALLLTRRAGRKTAIALGPFLLLGTGAGLVLGGLGS